MNRKVLIAALLLTLACGARAQGYPAKPVTLIVPFSPGGLADLVARVVAFNMEKTLHQPVIVTNRAGASGAIGTAAMAKAPPDGYTLLLTLTSHVVLPESDRLLGRTPAYELSQFKPVARISFEPVVLMGEANSKNDSLQKVVEHARAKPGTVSYSSTGYYANGHVSMEGFTQAAGIKLLHIPYQGGGPALAAVAGGQVNLTTAGPASASSFARSGRLRALAILGDKRVANMPEVPTLRELGYDSTYYVWSGLFAPAGTPADVVDALRASIRTMAADPQFKTAMDKMEATLGRAV
jgi:tripartite-type tricarboxylate transporter receptor subunit TctC